MKSPKFYSNIKLAALGFLCFTAFQANATSYNLSFTASGASSSVGSIVVLNTTQGTKTTVPSGNTLQLTSTTALNQVNAENNQFLFKTDAQGNTSVNFKVNQSGFVQFNVMNLEGRKIAGMNNIVTAGQCNYQVRLPQGMYLIQAQGKDFNYAQKLLVSHSEFNNAQLSFVGDQTTHTSSINKVKAANQGVTTMQCDAGDQILLKGNSGNYTTYVPVLAEKDSVVNFFFVDCTDADGNHYPVVNIGGQFWMAENLKTTKYSDGSKITLSAPVEDNSKVPAANYPNNDQSLKDIFGMFYNWPAVDPAKNVTKSIAPAGWHVPNYWELNGLVTTVGLGNCWYDLRDTEILWNNVNGTPNTEATNATGFSAKPAGLYWGSTYDPNAINKTAWIWSTTPALSGGLPNVLFMDISSKSPNALINSSDVTFIVMSVRCIHD